MLAISPIAAIVIAALFLALACISLLGAIYSERTGERAERIGYAALTIVFSVASAAIIVLHSGSPLTL